MSNERRRSIWSIEWVGLKYIRRLFLHMSQYKNLGYGSRLKQLSQHCTVVSSTEDEKMVIPFDRRVPSCHLFHFALCHSCHRGIALCHLSTVLHYGAIDLSHHPSPSDSTVERCHAGTIVPSKTMALSGKRFHERIDYANIIVQLN